MSAVQQFTSRALRRFGLRLPQYPNLIQGCSATQQRQVSWFSTDQTSPSSKESQQGEPADEPSTSEANGNGGAQGQRSADELRELLQAKEADHAKLTDQVAKLTDSLKRTLADMENLRTRTAKEVDNAKKFALQGFAKSLLDVVDNLERARSVVPPELLADDAAAPPEASDKARATLRGLCEGVAATENIMLKVLAQHGVQRYDPMGHVFDPNLHSALFEMPDSSKPAGTIAAVNKRGYTLNERVIRPAEVGVVKH